MLMGFFDDVTKNDGCTILYIEGFDQIVYFYKDNLPAFKAVYIYC